MIERTSDGLVGCSLEKVKVFTTCIVPTFREFYKGMSD